MDTLGDIIVTKDELIELFEKEQIIDSGKGWYMDNKLIELIALHEVEPKFLQDLANAKYYKIVFKNKVN